MSKPAILTELQNKGLNIGQWEANHLINCIRADQIRLEDFNLSMHNRELITILLRRADWLEKKFEGSKVAHVYADQECAAIYWHIAVILYIVGEKEGSETE